MIIIILLQVHPLFLTLKYRTLEGLLRFVLLCDGSKLTFYNGLAWFGGTVFARYTKGSGVET